MAIQSAAESQRKWKSPWKWVKSHRPTFLVQLIYWALVVIGFVAGANLLFSLVLNPTDQKQPEEIDVTRMALTVAAGFGGLVALVVAYRKQRDAEEGRFVERFGAAAEQLGHTDVAVRMAGVYAMAGVADRTKDIEQRQQCVDVLCGYLRLPYDPNFVENNQILTIVRDSEGEGTNPSREIHFQYRQNDREVRNTIVRIIADHLRRNDDQCWSKCSLDFTGVFFDGANFNNANFSGKTTLFEKATFSGEWTVFEEATFSGEKTSFDGATFSGKQVLFPDVRFSGEKTSFYKVLFGSECIWFDRAVFSGDVVSFEATIFRGETISFDEAVFDGKSTSFNWADFSMGLTTFNRATFSAKIVDFRNPIQWNPAPQFDWSDQGSGILKPDNVKLDEWPPKDNHYSEPDDS